jgi:hypothetical protein
MNVKTKKPAVGRRAGDGVTVLADAHDFSRYSLTRQIELAEAEAAKAAGDPLAFARARRRFLLLQAVAYAKARAGVADG